MIIVLHFASSPHVTLLSWFSVLALTITLAPTRVVSIQRISHATSADLPGPRPEAMAFCNTSIRSGFLFFLM